MIHSRHEFILIVIRYFPLNCCTSHNTTGTNLPITKIVKFSKKKLEKLEIFTRDVLDCKDRIQFQEFKMFTNQSINQVKLEHL